MSTDTRNDSSTGATSRGGGVTGWLIGFLVIVALIIGGVIAWAALTDDEGSEGADVGVTANDIMSDPEEYYGVGVTVSGEVNEVIAPNALTIGGEGFGGGEDLLIVSASNIPVPPGTERDEAAAVLEDDLIQTTGTVQELIIVDVEEELGIDLDDELFADFEGEPAIVAQNINLTPRLSNLPTGAISIEDITDDEDAFDGQQVSLTGEASELIGQQAFMLGENRENEGFAVDFGESILVLTREGIVPEEVVEGVPVEVSGTVRVFREEDEAANEAALEEEFGFDIEDGILGGWDDEPILIADSVTAGAAATIDIERIMTDALAYVGNQVTTGGVVEEVISPEAFVLTSENDDAVVEVEVLVVGQEGVFTEQIVNEAFVQVSGTVYIWDAAFEEEVGNDFPFLFEEDAFDDFEEGSVVIVADSIQVVR